MDIEVEESYEEKKQELSQLTKEELVTKLMDMEVNLTKLTFTCVANQSTM